MVAASRLLQARIQPPARTPAWHSAGTQFASTTDTLLWPALTKKVAPSRKGGMSEGAQRTVEKGEAEDDGDVKHNDCANHEGDGCPDPCLRVLEAALCKK